MIDGCAFLAKASKRKNLTVSVPFGVDSTNTITPHIKQGIRKRSSLVVDGKLGADPGRNTRRRYSRG